MQNQQENNKYAPIWSIKAFAKMIMKLESLDSSLIITENGFHYAKLFPEAYKKVKQKEILPDEHYLIKLSEAAQK